VKRSWVAAFAIAAALGCRSKPAGAPPARAAAPAEALAWRPVGSWSGRGNLQTSSFESGSGQLRVRWKTTNAPRPGGGRFELSAHSAISGRVLEVVTDAKGAGEGTGYVDQDPHVFYMEVESSDLDWTFAVDEAVSGVVEGGTPRPQR
jgi:hypothetical protein